MCGGEHAEGNGAGGSKTRGDAAGVEWGEHAEGDWPTWTKQEVMQQGWSGVSMCRATGATFNGAEGHEAEAEGGEHAGLREADFKHGWGQRCAGQLTQ